MRGRPPLSAGSRSRSRRTPPTIRVASRPGVARALEWSDAGALAALHRFEVALAAEVLYDPRRVEAVVQAIAALLAPGGRAFVADPERLGHAPFAEAAREAGLEVTLVESAPH